MPKVSMHHVKALYVRYRRLYFAEFDLPDVDDVEFEWMEVPGLHGQSYPDSDSPVIRLHQEVRQHPRLACLILMHEMSHLAHPRVEHGRKWTEEALRLGKLGALREFF